MKQFTNGKRVIEATEKMHRLIYKAQGFITINEFNEKLKDMNLAQLKGLAKERRLEGYSSLEKEELIDLLSFGIKEESNEDIQKDEKQEETVDSLKVGV